MRVAYIPLSDADWAAFYLADAKQTGHGLEGFHGVPYQRGNGLGSLFRGLFRMILPVAKKVGKAVGKQALRSGAKVASDVVSGDYNIQDSLKKRGREAASSLLTKAGQHFQKGSGLGRPPKRRKRTKTIKESRAANKQQMIIDNSEDDENY